MKIRNLLLISLCIVMFACTPRHTGNFCSGNNQYLLQDTLYFGTEKKGGFVTQDEWTDFLDNVITPRFSDGLTVTKASGQWKNGEGKIIKEPSYILTLIHPDEIVYEASVNEIIESYKRRFNQESVLRVKQNVCVSFTTPNQ